MEKPHIRVIQRNGVDIFVTSSIKMKVPERKTTGRPLGEAQEEALRKFYLDQAYAAWRHSPEDCGTANDMFRYNESTSDLWEEVIRDSDRNKHGYPVRMDTVYYPRSPRYHNE